MINCVSQFDKNIQNCLTLKNLNIKIWIMWDHVTLKTGVLMQKIQLCITRINYSLKYIKIENSYFKLYNNI